MPVASYSFYPSRKVVSKIRRVQVRLWREGRWRGATKSWCSSVLRSGFVVVPLIYISFKAAFKKLNTYIYIYNIFFFFNFKATFLCRAVSPGRAVQDLCAFTGSLLLDT